MGATWTPPNWYWNTATEFKWVERFAWWPVYSYESRQRIWLKTYWYGWRWIDGPAGEDPLKSERWLTDEEYIWFQLTNA